MKSKITVDEIVNTLGCQLIHHGDKDYVKWVVASSLMSDVLTTEMDEILLVSNLTTTQLVRTADMVGANAILIASGKPIMDDTIELSKELNITILRSEQNIFEVCYLLGKLFYEE